jgi:hypothetical protein
LRQFVDDRRIVAGDEGEKRNMKVGAHTDYESLSLNG